MTTPRDSTGGSAPRDADRLISAFLAEGQAQLPDQVYDEVRAEIDHTSQRTGIGPWRTSFMNRFASVVAVAVVMVIAVIVGLQLAGGGPLIGGDPSLTPSPAESVEPSVSEKPSAEPSAKPTEPATPSAEPSGPEPAFTCNAPITVAPVWNDFAPLVVADIRLGSHDGYDRIVFEYVQDGTPELVVDAVEPPFIRDPSGLEITVAGSPVYLLNINGATKFDQESGNQPYTGPTDFRPGYPQIDEFTESGDFEATNNWYLGVRGSTCLRAFALADPGRLVIDIQH